MDTQPAEPQPDGPGVDRLLWRTGQVISLVILVAEVGWLINHWQGGAPGRAVQRSTRRIRSRVSAEWRYLVAPLIAHQEAPSIIWQAWRHMEGEAP